MVETRKRKYAEDQRGPGKPALAAASRQSERLMKKQKQGANMSSTSLTTPPATPPTLTSNNDTPQTTPDAKSTTEGAKKRTRSKPTPKPKPEPQATSAPNSISTPLKRGRKWEIFFGREIKDDSAGVTDELLADFLENEVTARFPQGSTYTGATGQWARTLDDGSTVVVKEGTTVVFLVEFEGDDLRRVQTFRDLVADAARAYKVRFNQDAVLVCEIECLMDFI